MELIDELLIYIFKLENRRDEAIESKSHDEHKILNNIINELEEIVNFEEEKELAEKNK